MELGLKVLINSLLKLSKILFINMPAAYDNYDYPSYWKERSYEHQSEFIAIKGLLFKVPSINKVIEIGSGFGRLLPAYSYRCKNILLTDPSAKLISLSIKKYRKNKKIKFLQSTLENIQHKKGLGKFDLCVMVRVLHHIKDVDKALDIIYSLIVKNAYLILEFPNKNNLKANLRQIIKGDITYPLDIFPIDLRSKKHIRKKTLPFINYHPDQIIEKLKEHNFEIIEMRSVSNIRSTLIKRLFPINILLDLEKSLQIPFARLRFGPSFFVLAKKRG